MLVTRKVLICQCFKFVLFQIALSNVTECNQRNASFEFNFNCCALIDCAIALKHSFDFKWRDAKTTRIDHVIAATSIANGAFGICLAKITCQKPFALKAGLRACGVIEIPEHKPRIRAMDRNSAYFAYGCWITLLSEHSDVAPFLRQANMVR